MLSMVGEKDGVCMFVCAFSAAFDRWSLLSMKGGVCMCVYELVESIVNDRCSLSLTCFLHEFKIMYECGFERANGWTE